MNSFNRIVIFFMLIALLYALYTYQQQILSVASPKTTKNKKPNGKQNKNKSNSTSKKKGKNSKDKSGLKVNKLPKDNESIDKISLDGLSQMSLGSLEDLQTVDEQGYKQDSVLESLDDNNSLGSLLDDQSNDFFFR